MSNESIPGRDDLYGPWIINFASVATANATLLNLSVGQTSTLTSLATAFENAQITNTAAKLAAKGAASAKRGMRQATEDQFRSTAKVINANPNITNTLKSELGINVTPTPVGPVVPATDLTAIGYANGQNKLKWKRGTNAPGTGYLIEASYGDSEEWSFVAMSTATRYTHTSQTPGAKVTYRVISQRAGVQGGASNEAIVYGVATTPVLTLHEAA